MNKRAIRLATLLFCLLSAPSVGGVERLAGIQVDINPEKPLSLRVTVQSLAKTRVTIFRDSLPWGRKDSMMLVAVMPGGQCLERLQFIDDPTFQETSLDPGAKVTGELNLADRFKDLDAKVKKSEIHVFWVYKAPEQLNIGSWSGGWVLIPQQK